jgi:AraC-like DNA-binding protein
MTHFIGDQNYRMKMNDIMLVDHLVFHRTRYPDIAGSQERILLSFDTNAMSLITDEDVLAQVAGLFTLRMLQFVNKADHQAIVNDIMRVYETFNRDTSPLGLLRARFQLCELILSLVDLMQRGFLSSENRELNTAEKRVADVIGYLNENYACSLTLDALAKLFFIGKYTLCHEFKKVAGVTVIQYINRKRLAEAGRLLTDPSACIMEVSQAVGFNSLSQFNERFKLVFECTPTAYKCRNIPNK